MATDRDFDAYCTPTAPHITQCGRSVILHDGESIMLRETQLETMPKSDDQRRNIRRELLTSNIDGQFKLLVAMLNDPDCTKKERETMEQEFLQALNTLKEINKDDDEKDNALKKDVDTQNTSAEVSLIEDVE